MHLKLRPYAEKICDRAQAAASVQLVVSYATALLLTDEAYQTSSIGTVVIAVNCASLAISAAFVLRTLCSTTQDVISMQTPPTTEWKGAAGYACFLSHAKADAGMEARYMCDLLGRMLSAEVCSHSPARLPQQSS